MEWKTLRPEEDCSVIELKESESLDNLHACLLNINITKNSWVSELPGLMFDCKPHSTMTESPNLLEYMVLTVLISKF